MKDSFSYKAICGDQPMMVIVPHEDDEINLAGASIAYARKQGVRVIVVFATNGDWKYPGSVRLKEALNSLKYLGVPEKDVVFLGYPDGGMNGQRNVYLINGIDSITEKTPKAKCIDTYGLENHPDFSQLKNGYHHSVSWNHFCQDLKEVILMYRPQIIINVDFDFHPDHRMLSLGFEKIIGQIMKMDKTGYRPIILKGFCYATSFVSINDFYGRNLLSTVINKNELWNPSLETDNPSLAWKDRIRFPVNDECRTALRHNQLFAALNCHMSQHAARHAVRIINGDQVFWLRRTDNLILQGKITVSSGNGDYLNDFLTINTNHIVNKSPLMENYLWIPEEGDREKWCRCDFDKPCHIEAIALYGNADWQNQILKIRLLFSNGFDKDFGSLALMGKRTFIKISPQDDVKWIKLEVLEVKGGKAGIAEWEAFSTADAPFSVIKICINDNFAYKWHVYNDEHSVVSAYTYGISGKLRWYVNGMKSTLNAINKEVNRISHPLFLRVESVNDPSVYSEAALYPVGPFYRITHFKDILMDRIWVWCKRQIENWKHHGLKKIE